MASGTIEMRMVVVFMMGNLWRVVATGILHNSVDIVYLMYQALILQALQHTVYSDTIAQAAELLLKTGMRKGNI